MDAHTTTTENTIEFEPVVTFDDETVRMQFTRTLAINMSRVEFDLLTFVIRTGYAKHLERVDEIDRWIDRTWPDAELVEVEPEPADPFAMGGLSAVVFGT